MSKVIYIDFEELLKSNFNPKNFIDDDFKEIIINYIDFEKRSSMYKGTGTHLFSSPASQLMNQKEQKIFLNNIKELADLYGESVLNKIRFEGGYKIDEALKASSKINEWVEEINSARVDGKKLSPLEKYAYAYTIATNFYYNSETEIDDISSSRLLISVLGGERNFVVCAGFANLLSELCNRLGISCAQIGISLKNKKESSGHAINSIMIKDKKYNFSELFYANPTNDAHSEENYLKKELKKILQPDIAEKKYFFDRSWEIFLNWKDLEKEYEPEFSTIERNNYEEEIAYFHRIKLENLTEETFDSSFEGEISAEKIKVLKAYKVVNEITKGKYNNSFNEKNSSPIYFEGTKLYNALLAWALQVDKYKKEDIEKIIKAGADKRLLALNNLEQIKEIEDEAFWLGAIAINSKLIDVMPKKLLKNQSFCIELTYFLSFLHKQDAINELTTKISKKNFENQEFALKILKTNNNINIIDKIPTQCFNDKEFCLKLMSLKRNVFDKEKITFLPLNFFKDKNFCLAFLNANSILTDEIFQIIDDEYLGKDFDFEIYKKLPFDYFKRIDLIRLPKKVWESKQNCVTIAEKFFANKVENQNNQSVDYIFSFIPNKFFKDDKFVESLISINGYFIYHISKFKANRELYLLALNNTPELINKIPKRYLTNQACLRVLRKNSLFFNAIPREFQNAEMVVELLDDKSISDENKINILSSIPLELLGGKAYLSIAKTLKNSLAFDLAMNLGNIFKIEDKFFYKICVDQLDFDNLIIFINSLFQNKRDIIDNQFCDYCISKCSTNGDIIKFLDILKENKYSVDENFCRYCLSRVKSDEQMVDALNYITSIFKSSLDFETCEIIIDKFSNNNDKLMEFIKFVSTISPDLLNKELITYFMGTYLINAKNDILAVYNIEEIFKLFGNKLADKEIFASCIESTEDSDIIWQLSNNYLTFASNAMDKELLIKIIDKLEQHGGRLFSKLPKELQTKEIFDLCLEKTNFNVDIFALSDMENVSEFLDKKDCDLLLQRLEFYEDLKEKNYKVFKMFPDIYKDFDFCLKAFKKFEYDLEFLNLISDDNVKKQLMDYYEYQKEFYKHEEVEESNSTNERNRKDDLDEK